MSRYQTFTGKGKRKSKKTLQFLDYIDKCREYGITATKKRYLVGIRGLKVVQLKRCPVCVRRGTEWIRKGDRYEVAKKLFFRAKKQICENCGLCWDCCRAVCNDFTITGICSLAGHSSTWFSAMQHVGIVTKERFGRTFIYKRGPNAEKFEKGEF